MRAVMKRVVYILLITLVSVGAWADTYRGIYTTSSVRTSSHLGHGAIVSVGANAPAYYSSSTTVVGAVGGSYSVPLTAVGNKSVGYVATTATAPVSVSRRRGSGFGEGDISGIPNPDEPGKDPNDPWGGEGLPENPPEPPGDLPLGDWPAGLLLVMLVWYGVKKMRMQSC